MQGWKKNMEDEQLVEINVCEDTSIFGVFDGHGGIFNSGIEVARYIKNNIVHELIENSDFKSGNVQKALVDTFNTIDKNLESPKGKKDLLEISKEVSASQNLQFLKNESEDLGFFVGSTACLAILKKNHLYVANCGDCRCVIFKGGKAIDLSRDHKPNLQDEKARIEKAGGYIEDNKIKGLISVSRCFGDFEYKKTKNTKSVDQMITANPEVKDFEISKDCEFFIIACDGIWDCLDSQKCCEWIKDRIEKIKESRGDIQTLKISKIVESFVDNLLPKDVSTSGGIGCDNLTCILVLFKQ